jgi:hypothetical protein
LQKSLIPTGAIEAPSVFRRWSRYGIGARAQTPVLCIGSSIEAALRAETSIIMVAAELAHLIHASGNSQPLLPFPI